MGGIPLSRSCQFCENAALVTRHKRATDTYYCSYWGRVVTGDQSCMFYVRRQRGTRPKLDNFDMNIAWDLLQKQQSGELPPKPTNPDLGPARVDTHELRNRAKRRQGLI